MPASRAAKKNAVTTIPGVKKSPAELLAEVNSVFGAGSVTMASHPDLVVGFLPTECPPIDYLLHGGLPMGRFTELYGDYCISPETKVLTDALQWVQAGDLGKDYGLIGFDEKLNQGRGKSVKMQPSHLQVMGFNKLESVRVVTDKGEMTCSIGHGFVAYNSVSHQREWRRAGDLRVGDRLLWTAEPWNPVNNRDAGWAAGIIDGEGWLDGKRLSVGQNPGVVMGEYIRVMKGFGFDLDVRIQNPKVGPCIKASIHGGRWETMRALGQLKSVRFLSRGVDVWNGADLISKGPFVTPGSAYATVSAVEKVGKQDVVTMQTSTKTFIANGFPSHNSSLKSYIGYKAIASAQKRGMLAALIDTEHAFNPDWAEQIGVNTEDLIYKQPENGEEAIDLAEVLMRGGVDLIVFDSVHAAIPQAEQNKQLHTENVQPARLAALMSIAMRKLTAANKFNTAVLWINQTRLNVGITYGNPETVPGGRALPYYASYRIGLKKAGRMFQNISVVSQKADGKREKKSVKLAIGQQIRATVEKSKLSSPFRDIEFTFSFNRGEIDNWNFLANLALDADVIGQGAGYWWEIGSKNKQREAQFRGQHDEAWLVENLMGKVPHLEAVAHYLGVKEHVKQTGSTQKRKSSKVTELKSTRVQGPEKSRMMDLIKKESTKSRMLKKSTA